MKLLPACVTNSPCALSFGLWAVAESGARERGGGSLPRTQDSFVCKMRIMLACHRSLSSWATTVGKKKKKIGLIIISTMNI